MSGVLFVALALSAPPTTSPPQRLTVSVDLARLDRPRFDALDAAKFYQSLVLRFVAEGLAVIDPTQGADIAIAIATDESGAFAVTVESVRGGRSASVAMELPLDESTRLHLVHTTLVLAREALADLCAVTEAPLTREPTPSPPAVQKADVGVSAHAAALRSMDDWGVLSSVEVRAKRGRWSGVLGSSGHVPVGISRHLQIREWGAYVGAGADDTVLASWLAWRAEVLGGVWQQVSHYQNDAGVNAADSRFDPFLSLRFSALATLGAWHLGVELGALGLLHDRVYRTSTTLLWHAPHIRPYFGAVVDYAWTGKSP
ncbi:MAG: hypothetical protein AAB426_07180 [Myxococcota bacterium]